MVVFRSTTPCVRLSSASKSYFLTVNSIYDFLRRKPRTQTGYSTLF